MIAAEAQQLGGFVGQAVAQPLLSAGVLLSVASYMLWIEPQVALVAFAFFIPVIADRPLAAGAHQPLQQGAHGTVARPRPPSPGRRQAGD